MGEKGHRVEWLRKGRWIWEKSGRNEYDQNTLYEVLRELRKKNTVRIQVISRWGVET